MYHAYNTQICYFKNASAYMLLENAKIRTQLQITWRFLFFWAPDDQGKPGIFCHQLD